MTHMDSIERKKYKKPRVRIVRDAELAKSGRSIPIILSGLFMTVMILLACVLTFVTDDRQYSETENRELAGRPVFSVASVRDGKFMEDVEEYLSDQFYQRDLIVTARTYIDLFFGKKEVNGVYTFDRRPKFDVSRAKKVLCRKAAIED